MVIIFATKYEGVTLYTHFFFRLEYITKDNERHQKSIFLYHNFSLFFFNTNHQNRQMLQSHQNNVS